jgi:hypothetical protein
LSKTQRWHSRLRFLLPLALRALRRHSSYPLLGCPALHWESPRSVSGDRRCHFPRWSQPAPLWSPGPLPRRAPVHAAQRAHAQYQSSLGTRPLTLFLLQLRMRMRERTEPTGFHASA